LISCGKICFPRGIFVVYGKSLVFLDKALEHPCFSVNLIVVAHGIVLPFPDSRKLRGDRIHGSLLFIITLSKSEAKKSGLEFKGLIANEKKIRVAECELCRNLVNE
jgi:hypothetical protein